MESKRSRSQWVGTGTLAPKELGLPDALTEKLSVIDLRDPREVTLGWDGCQRWVNHKLYNQSEMIY